MGLYFSIINVIPFIIDGILYGKFKNGKIYLFSLYQSLFFEFLFSLGFIANNNAYAYSLRENTQMLQICSLFGCYFLSFAIALFSSLLDYSICLYVDEKAISKFVICYAILISFIYFFGFIRLLIPEEKGAYNIGISKGISNYIYEHEQSIENYVKELDEYVQYINHTIRKAKEAYCKIMTYAEKSFVVYLKNKPEVVERIGELAKEYQMLVLFPVDVFRNNTNTNEAWLFSDQGDLIYNYQK